VTGFQAADRGPVHVVAVSADGRMEVVGFGVGSDDSDGGANEYRLRSRAGLLSRESPRELACMADWAGSSQIKVSQVRFTSDREVDLHTSDGAAWTIAFDPRSLTPAHKVSNCVDGGSLQIT